MKYLAIIMKRGNGYSAFVPDLPGCVAAGDTHEETGELIRQAVEYHLELMAEDGEPIPEPSSTAVEVKVEGPEAK